MKKRVKKRQIRELEFKEKLCLLGEKISKTWEVSIEFFLSMFDAIL